MQTKYYLSFEQVGIIRRIPLKEQAGNLRCLYQSLQNR